MKKAVGLRNFFKMYYDGFRNLSKTSKNTVDYNIDKTFYNVCSDESILVPEFSELGSR